MPRRKIDNPLIPGAVMSRREQRVLRDRMDGKIPEKRLNKCTARTFKTKAPCPRLAIPGGYVCDLHGGKTPSVKEAARKRLQALVDPTITRLVELRDQGEHLPTAFNAVKEILSQAGVTGKDASDTVRKTPIINIGIVLGGAPGHETRVQAQLVSASNDDVIDAESASDEDDGV